MSFDMQNQVFMKERLEKRTICKNDHDGGYPVASNIFKRKQQRLLMTL